MFEQLWIECEKTNSPTTSKSGKSKKCKASKSATIVGADSDKTETVEVVDTTVWYDPPPVAQVGSTLNIIIIFRCPY